MVIKKSIKLDNTYSASFNSTNAVWWNTNIDLVIGDNSSLVSSGAYSWFNGIKIPIIPIYGNSTILQSPLLDEDSAPLYAPYPTVNGPYDRQTQDIRDSAYITSWLNYCKSLVDLGAEGVFISNLSLEPEKNAVRDGGIEPGIDLSWWPSAVNNFLNIISSEMKQYKPGFLVVHDVSWEDLNPRRWEDPRAVEQIKASDLINITDVTNTSLNEYNAQNPAIDYKQYSLRSLFSYIDFIHLNGGNVIINGNMSNAENQKFTSACYRLVHASGDYISINGITYPTTIPSVITTNYGNALGVRKDQYEDPNNLGYIYRNFYTGNVRVTPIKYGEYITTDSSFIDEKSQVDNSTVLKFPVTNILDTFNQSGSLGVPYISPAFTNPYEAGTAAMETRVSGTEIGASTTTNRSIAYNTVFNRDQELFLTRTNATANTVHLNARLSLNSSNQKSCYVLIVTDTWMRLGKYIDDVLTYISSQYNVTVVANSRVGLRANGSTISAYIDTGAGWSKVIESTDISIKTGGLIGIRFNTTTTASIDNFGGGNIEEIKGEFSTSPSASTFNIEALSAGSSIDKVEGSGASKKGIESVLEYNGLILNDTSKFDRYIVTKIDGLFGIDIRDNRVAKPNQNGEIVQDSKYGGRTITIEGKILAQSREKLLDMETAMQMAFGDLKENSLVFRTGDIRRDYYIDCKNTQPISMVEDQESNTHYHYRTFVITLRASDPFFYSVNTIEQESSISVGTDPTYIDNFSTSTLTYPEYDESDSNYYLTNLNKGKIVEGTGGSGHAPVFSISSGKLAERKLSIGSSIITRQTSRDKLSNFTQVVKVNFDKLPLKHASNTDYTNIRYPIVNMVSEHKGPEAYYFKLHEFWAVANGTKRTLDLTKEHYKYRRSSQGGALNNSFKFTNTEFTSNGDVLDLGMDGFFNEYQTTPILYGSDANTDSGNFTDSYILENTGTTYEILPSTDYWFLISSSLLEKNGRQYKITTKRVYDVDPFGGTNPSPVASYVYRHGVASASAPGGPMAEVDGYLGIASTGSDTNAIKTLNGYITGTGSLGPSSPVIAENIKYALDYMQSTWAMGVISYWNRNYPLINVVISDTPLASTKHSYSVTPGFGTSSTRYESGDKTFYDDWKVFNYDTNSPDDTYTDLITANNNGNYNVLPVFEIKSDAQKPITTTNVLTISNNANGKFIKFNTTTTGRFIPDGETLVVDCKNKKAYLKNSKESYINYISFDSSWIDLELGFNGIAVSSSDVSFISTDIKYSNIYL